MSSCAAMNLWSMLKVPKAKRCEANPAVVSCACVRKVAPCCLFQSYGAVQCCAMLCRLQQSCISGEHHSILGDREKCRGTFKDVQSDDPRKSHSESFGRVSHNVSQYIRWNKETIWWIDALSCGWHANQMMHKTSMLPGNCDLWCRPSRHLRVSQGHIFEMRQWFIQQIYGCKFHSGWFVACA